MALDYSDKLLPVSIFDDRMTGASKLLGVKTTEDTADNAVLIDLNSLIGNTIVIERADWENKNGLVTFKGIQDCLADQHDNLQGIQGLQGLQGIQGIQGDASLQLQGLQGIQGVQGIDGNKNSEGPQGLQGISEELTFQDYQIRSVGISKLGGLQGIQGIQGIQGGTYLGPQGIQGIQGIQGTYGKSIQGPQGTQGIQGTEIGKINMADFYSYESIQWRTWTNIFDCALVIKGELHAKKFDRESMWFSGENLGPWLVQGFDPNLPHYNPEFIRFIRNHYPEDEGYEWESKFYITEDELHRNVTGVWGDDIQVDLDNYQDLDLLDLEFSGITGITKDWYTGNGDNLVAIALPATCQVSGENIFSGMSNLDTVGWPDSSIGINDFAYCTSLKYVLRTSESSDFISYINSYAFIGCSSLVYVAGITNETVVEEGAFEGCSSFSYTKGSSTKVVHLTDYRSGVFSGCTSISNVVIDSTCEILESNAFEGCQGIRSVLFPTEPTAAQYNEFWSKTPPVVGERSPFEDCENLQSIMGVIAGSTPTNILYLRNIPGQLFSNIKSNYINGNGYEGFSLPIGTSSTEGFSCLERIGYRSFYGSTISNTTLRFPVIRYIEDSAFQDCKIGYNTNTKTYDCHLEIPYHSDCNIGEYAFAGSTLKSIDLNLNEGVINNHAFENCEQLESVRLTNLCILSNYVFSECTNLQSVTLININVIIDNNFIGCSKLQSIKYSNNAPCDQSSHLIPRPNDVPLFGDCTRLDTISFSWSEGDDYYDTRVIPSGFFRDIHSSATHTIDNIERKGYQIIFSDDLRIIGEMAFARTDSGTGVVYIANTSLSLSDVEIGDKAFYKTLIGLAVQLGTYGPVCNVTLSDCRVGNEAFRESTVNSLSITGGTIGDRAFYNLNHPDGKMLTSITLTDVESIGSQAFARPNTSSQTYTDVTDIYLDITDTDEIQLPRLYQVNGIVDVFGTRVPSQEISVHCTQSIWDDMIDNESDTTGWKWLLDNHYIQRA